MDLCRKTKKVTFLFGAGISIPAGLPSTGDITKRVLGGADIFKHTDDNYYLGKEPSLAPDNAYMSRVIIVLNHLNDYLKEYYKGNDEKIINYEDLYLLADVLYKTEGNWRNPHTKPFLNEILPIIRPLLKDGVDEFIKRHWRPIDIFAELRKYIRDVVWHLLSVTNVDISYLSAISEACMDNKVGEVTIFSLNHDLILEKTLYNSSIIPCDGFGEPEAEVRYWNPVLFERSKNKVKLYKIHGSVNWFKFTGSDFDPYTDRIGIPQSNDIWHTKNLTGDLQWPKDGRPVILAGTENKILEYSSGIFLSIISRFREHLESVDLLIISGYSFGDIGINRLIFDWLFGDKERQILLITPSKNPWILGRLRIGETVVHIQKPIQEIVYSDLVPHIFK